MGGRLRWQKGDGYLVVVYIYGADIPTGNRSFLFYPISQGCKPISTDNGSFSQRVKWPLQFKILYYVFGIVNITILPSHFFFPLLSQLFRFNHSHPTPPYDRYSVYPSFLQTLTSIATLTIFYHTVTEPPKPVLSCFHYNICHNTTLHNL